MLTDALRAPESDVRVFAGHESDARRPLGVAVVTALDVTTARSPRPGGVGGVAKTLVVGCGVCEVLAR